MSLSSTAWHYTVCHALQELVGRLLAPASSPPQPRGSLVGLLTLAHAGFSPTRLPALLGAQRR